MTHAIEVRLAQARSRFNRLNHLWKSCFLSKRTKLRLYECVVCSILSHGFECWRFTGDNFNCRVTRMINGWNARSLAVMSGRQIKDEARKPSFDLVSALRVRRLRWLGHVLRMDDRRLVKRVLMATEQPYQKGSIFSYAPSHDTTVELETLAQNRDGWNETVNKLKSLLLGDKNASLKVTRRETKRTSSKVTAGPGSKWGFGIAR